MVGTWTKHAKGGKNNLDNNVLLSTQGPRIVNGAGDQVVLRGFGMGG
jgi:hypothetical protein